MKVSELINQNLIISHLKSNTKKHVIEEMVQHLSEHQENINPDELVNVLVEREKLGSTGIGNGIAIPHGKLRGLEEIILMFGKSDDGISFESIDGKPVNLIFLLVAPSNSAGDHLKALARLSRLLKEKTFRQKLMTASNESELFDCIVEADNTV